ncbi:glycosyltransferase [Candidatus Marinimicrobia bacterium MT.SAG.2]|nr:glycosyltransferase [Candidatus Marinimicrobia bacterium MT.SAG.2]
MNCSLLGAVMNDYNNKKIAVIAYTNYLIDPRVRRISEALVEGGYEIDVYVLGEEGKSSVMEIGGVRVKHQAISQYRGDSTFAYILSYFKFFFIIFNKLSGKQYRRNYELIYVHNMPNFIVFSALIPSFLGTKIILDIHDSMPELFATKFPGRLSQLVHYFLLLEEKLSVAFVDQVFTVHTPQKEFLIKTHRIPERKITEITNLADRKLFDPLNFRKSDKKDNIFRLIYHGTIARRFALEVVIEGIGKIKTKFPNIRLDIYGEGDQVSNIENMVEKQQISEFVKIHGIVPLDEIPQLISEADLGIVSYRADAATDLMLPLKLLEYTSLELPALSIKNKAISYYFGENDLEYYEAGNPSSFADKLEMLILNPHRLRELSKCAGEFNKLYQWDKERSKLIRIIGKLIDEKN